MSISEEQIRPEILMRRKESCIAEDIRFLVAQKGKWVYVDCPCCGRTEYTDFGAKSGFSYVECNECKTVYTNPRPSEELLENFYATSQNYIFWNQYIFPATEKTRRENIFRPRAERVMRACKKFQVGAQNLMEVGAGFGLFCEEIRKLGVFRSIIAVEPTRSLAETCRNKAFKVIGMPFEKIVQCEKVDVLAAFEVIEHVFSPKKFLVKSNSLLKDGGLLFITCPNIKGFDIALLGVLSNTFDHEHLNYFHKKSIGRLFLSCGFDIIELETPGRLDADIARKFAIKGILDLNSHPILHEILIDRWEELGGPFQDFLEKNQLSSHMWITARKK
jgi:2-polyprenyl-3-methyl-5-hydroxy-6-metoxy-1,4-benzoquinol methylase